MRLIRTVSIFLFFYFFALNVQSQVITGKVIDKKTEEEIVGATVKLKGTKIATLTDIDGNFILTVDSVHKVLVIESIEYQNKEIEIKIYEKKHYIVVLEVPVESEAVYVESGYNSKKRESITGLISTTETVKISEKIIPAPSKKNISESHNNISSGTLTAGEINDFSKWILWNDKSQEELIKHKTEWSFYPSIRFSVIVQNQDGFPMIGENVVLLDKNQDTVWRAKTDNLGKVELWANMFGEKYYEKDTFSITLYNEGIENTIINAKEFHDGINLFIIKKKCDIPKNVDAVFVVDATGSMSDELNFLKIELEDVINNAKENNLSLNLSLGSVFYRDVGDEYITRKQELSSDISTTIRFIKKQTHGGGGDFPEAVKQALNVAVNEMNWSENTVTKIIFLVLDAPPHQTTEIIERLQKITYRAAELGIKIIPITSSGINKSTEYLMRSLALGTNGTYVFLTDDSGVGEHHIAPTTDSYEVEKLNTILIRLFKQYTSVISCEKNLVADISLQTDTTIMQNESVAVNDTISKATTEIENLTETEFSCKLYPNPTSGLLNIEIIGNIKELFVTDVSGKILERILIDGNKIFQTDISRYPRGVYLITYFGINNKVITGKIILNK